MQNRALAVVASLLLLSSAGAAAQEKATSFQVEHFEPMPLQNKNIGGIASSEPMTHLDPSFGVTLHFVDDPIEVRTNDEVTSRLVDDQLKAELLAGVGLFGVADIGFAIPIVLYQSADDLSAFGNPDGASSFTVADARLVPRVRLVRPEWAGGVGVAVLLPVYLPIGDTNSFNGDGSVRVEPRVAVDWSHPVGMRLLANLGVQLRGKQEASTYRSDDALRWGVAAEVPVGLKKLRATAALFGAVGLASESTRGAPVEAQAGVRAQLLPTLLVHGGLGAGLTPSVGSPDFRVIAGVEWTPVISHDADRDGIANSADECPRDAEDLDGFQDEDGCPDLDDDGDGVPDASDGCKMEAEDRDGFEDLDGCPDLDNDGDGLLDVDDRCPDTQGPEGTMGCAPEDTDGDGKYDHEEQCPEQPEDMDGFQDEDGCPEPDNDFDGFLDADDACPLEAEVYNGRKDDDGCADTPASRIQLTATEIVLLESMDFGKGTTARYAGRRILNQAGDAMNQNSWAGGFRIEVHTAGTTPEEEALALTRALSLMDYLVKSRKVPAERLEAVARPGSKPSDPAAPQTAERTEIHIVAPSKPSEAATDAETAEPEEPEETEEPEDGGGFDFSEERE